MSLAEVTGGCFQNGVTASKWATLVRLWKDKHSNSMIDFEGDLSNSILSLFHSYHAHPTLLSYIKHALRTSLLTLPSFVVAFLQAAKSPNLHDTATLDALCRLVQDERFLSGLPPLGSLVRFGESTITVLATVQDSLNLLRTAYALPMSSFHNLTASASELVILLLSCVGDMSQVSTAQAMIHFAEVHEMLQTLRLQGDIRSVLENFALSLSILLGDDAKMAQEAQMMQTLQLALGKGDISGPSSDSDMITCSLVLRYLVGSRELPFGSGNTPLAVTVLVSAFRGNSWSPSGFYAQLFLAAFSCLAQESTHRKSTLMWRSFIIGRLPMLLIMFEQVVSLEGDIDWRTALQAAVSTLWSREDLLAQSSLSVPRPTDDTNAEQESARIAQSKEPHFLQCFLQYYMTRAKLLERSFVLSIDPTLPGELRSQLTVESIDAGLELDAFIESRLSADSNTDDAMNFLRRAVDDYASHPTFAQVVQKRFIASSHVQAGDIEGLSHLCKIMYLHETAIDIVSLYVRISTIVAHTLAFVADFDCELVGDPQTAVSHLGDVVMFLQGTLIRFHLTNTTFTVGDRTLNPQFLLGTARIYRVSELANDEIAAFHAWLKALFDSNSEGIEDNILRATNPRTLLKLSATLIFQAIKAASEGMMESDLLKNGVSYFTGPLLNWTLVGVIKALIRDIVQKEITSPMYWEVLRTLVLSPSCPEPILHLTAHGILRFVSGPRVQKQVAGIEFDIDALRRIANHALRNFTEDSPDMDPQSLTLNAQPQWLDQPRQYIHGALRAARAGKAPCFDLGRCCAVLGPTKFLRLLWQELSGAAQMGDVESSRRIATFALTCPADFTSHLPPLLPIFLHTVLPTLLPALDSQIPPEQTLNIELLVAVISSSLTVLLQMEWAIRAVDGEPRHPAGQPSATNARRLALDLRRSKSSTAGIITQRLSSMSSFVTNFPMMVSG
ncbi:hypothetical protein BD410DRAFT_893659 [Rickenella mellea]|uniref:Mediator of RNA polymerase II transcription subunit 5 n=1 Tax=Rickenella mellea TaxID=50990 RepID=A0A4Y7QM38_9AGAM|nr:hypothetical protein BD410DRAFT_893659 [Rickenella mellea]